MALPTGPAADPLGQADGPSASIVLALHVGKPLGCSCTPSGRYTLTPMTGGGEPKYSLPSMVTSPRAAAPAPSMSPVWGKPGMGTACALIFTVGAADAAAGAIDATRLSTRAHIRSLRIGSSFWEHRPAVTQDGDRAHIWICR